MTRPSRTTCKRCQNTCPTGKARGICSSCHETLRLRGHLDEYPVLRADTQGRVRPLYEQGKGAAEISRILGITRNAAWCAIRAIRDKEAGHHVTGYRYESPNGVDIWAKLHVPHPGIDDVECKSRHDLFVDWLDGNTRHLMRHGAPDLWAQTYIAAALAVCARCPVRDWCVTATKPEQSKVSIIAGGKVWHGGEVVWDLARQEALEAAQVAEVYGEQVAS